MKVFPLKDHTGITYVENGVVIDFTQRMWYSETEVKLLEQYYVSELGSINRCVNGMNKLIEK